MRQHSRITGFETALLEKICERGLDDVERHRERRSSEHLRASLHLDRELDRHGPPARGERCARRLGTRIAAGATVRHELAEQFRGELHGQIVDPFGHRWNVAQRLRDVPADEIAAAAARLFAGAGS
jgi:hypothetical protein